MFPGGRPPSIFSAKKLNYCVRNGNRCDLLAITTDLVKTRFSARFISEPSPFQAVSPLSPKTYWVFREPCFAFAPLRPLHLIVKHNVLRLIKRKEETYSHRRSSLFSSVCDTDIALISDFSSFPKNLLGFSGTLLF